MEAWNGNVWVLDGGLHTENEWVKEDSFFSKLLTYNKKYYLFERQSTG